MPEAVNLELAVRMPWLAAEPESIWAITGTYRDGQGTFTDCLAMVLPEWMTEGHRLFQLIHPVAVNIDPTDPNRLIAPDQISRARRLLLVYADDQRTAVRALEQDLIEQEENR